MRLLCFIRTKISKSLCGPSLKMNNSRTITLKVNFYFNYVGNSGSKRICSPQILNLSSLSVFSRANSNHPQPWRERLLNKVKVLKIGQGEGARGFLIHASGKEGTKEAEMANNHRKEKPAKLEEESRQRDAGGKHLGSRKLGVRSSEVGEGNFCVAQAGEQRAHMRLFGHLSRREQE